MYNYMRNETPDDWGIKELQEKILEIAVYVDQFCEENGIQYCLMGGSALGAIRHGGFIPWDDDLDIFMTPDNYEKFKDSFNSSGNKEKFYLQEWGSTEGMVTISKISMNGTSYIEESFKNWDIHHGIYIDIFILHKCPKNKIAQLHQCLWAKYVIMKGLAIRGYTRRGGFLGLVLKVMRLFPDRMWVKYGLKQVYRYRNKETDYFCNFMGKAVFKNAIYKQEWFEPAEYATFEKIQLKIPKNIHEFLSFRFGDYMKPPSEDRIKWEQHAESWDTEMGFEKVLSNTTPEYKDEKKLI